MVQIGINETEKGIDGRVAVLLDNIAESVSFRTLEKSYTQLEEPSYVDWHVYRAYYEELTDKEQLAYRCIYNEIFAHPERIAVPHLKQDEFEAVFNALGNDNPHLLFLGNEAVSLTAGLQCYFVPTYTLSYWEGREELEKSLVAARKILSEVPENGTQYELLLAAHDALIENCVYEQTGNDSHCNGALVYGKATCAGYAKALKLMCDLAGLQSCAVTGSGTDGDADTGTVNHMWLAVNADGFWSFCDPTWNDCVSADGMQRTEHGYFCVDEALLSRTHKDIVMPRSVVCNAPLRDYYIMQNLFCTASDYERILSDGVATALQNVKEMAEFRFDCVQTLQAACEFLLDDEQIYVLLAENAEYAPFLVTDKILYATDENRLILKLTFLFDE